MLIVVCPRRGLKVSMRSIAAASGQRLGRIAVPTSEEVFCDADPPLYDDDNEAYSYDGDDDDEPYDPHASGAGGTIQAAVFGIIKAMVGPAILYLPHSFADAGYVFALIALFLCLGMYLYSSRRLLETWHYVRSKKIIEDHGAIASSTTSNSGGLGNNEVEMVSLATYPSMTVNNTVSSTNVGNFASSDIPTIKSGGGNIASTNTSGSTNISYPQLAKMAYGEAGESIVRTGITLMQLGVCLTYFIFVPHNLSASIKSLLGMHVPMWICLIAMVGMEIPLSSIRNIRKLVHTNVLANALIAFGLISCLYLALTATSDDYETEEGYDGNNSNISGGGGSSPKIEFNMNAALETGAGTNTNTIRGDNRIIARIMEELSSTEAVGASTSKPLGAWNDKWYLFIGTSVSCPLFS